MVILFVLGIGLVLRVLLLAWRSARAPQSGVNRRWPSSRR